MLASLSLYALFFFPLVQNVFVDGKTLSIAIDGVFQVTNGQTVHTEYFVGLEIATAIIGLIPLYIISRFRNRPQQIALSYSAMLVIIGLSFWMSSAAKPYMEGIQIGTHNWGIGLLLSPVSLLFIVMAISAIRRDEKLVKSADRLR